MKLRLKLVEKKLNNRMLEKLSRLALSYFLLRYNYIIDIIWRKQYKNIVALCFFQAGSFGNGMGIFLGIHCGPLYQGQFVKCCYMGFSDHFQ